MTLLTMVTATRRTGGGGLIQPLHNCCDEESSSSLASTTLKNYDDIPCVLFLEGWSPGPLFHLRLALKQWQLPEHDVHDNNNARILTSGGGGAVSSGAGHRSSNTKKGTAIRILQPSLDMPPVTCGTYWCCNWRFVVMMITLFLYTWGARRTCQRVLEKQRTSMVHYYQYLILLTLIGLVLLRAIIAEVVRTSIRYNLDLCQRLLANNNIVMVVGFSWGGAIGAELVAQGILGSYYCENVNHNNNKQENNTMDAMLAYHLAQPSTNETTRHEPPAVLLIAPTTSLIASLSILKPYRTDAALRIASWRKQSTKSSSLLLGPDAEAAASENATNVAGNGNNNHLHRSTSSSPLSMAFIQVVHAQRDGCFCPHPERWQQRKSASSSSSSSSTTNTFEEGRSEEPRGRFVDLTIIPDENHIFQRSSTQRILTDIMFHLLRKKGAI